jgi:pyruvate kinase
VVQNERDLDDIREGQILIAKMVNEKYIKAIEKAAALVTEEGGLTSNGAILAVNMKKPAVVGAEKASEHLNTGDTVTVDTVRGLIYRGIAHVL